MIFINFILLMNLIYVHGLTAEWINAGSISADRLKANVITSINNSTGSTTINGGKITTNSITANHIQSNAVTADKINASAVTADKIASSAVTTAKINANAVTAAKINVSNLKAITVNIGPWTIDDAGFTDGSDAWVKPAEISCGKHGATLVKMLGKTSGTSGYLSVEVNESDDYTHVRYDGITKKNGGVTQYASWTSSDKRFKNNIEDLTIEESLDLISKVVPRKFEFKHEEGTRYGFIAQELRQKLDDDSAIEFTYGENKKSLYHAIHYEDFIAPLCNVVKLQQEEINDLKARLERLESIVNNHE